MTVSEKSIRAIGGSWTQALRPCSDCGNEHQHLTDLDDGRHVCVPCWFAPAYKED